MYVVEYGRGEEQFKSRSRAVAAARQLSRDSKRTVKIVRDGGVERMVYREGRLEEGIYETVDRRRRSARGAR